MKEVKIKVKQFGIDSGIKEGDYIEYDDIVYKFLGYEWGTYPLAENIETGEQVTLPHY